MAGSLHIALPLWILLAVVGYFVYSRLKAA